MFSAYNKKKRLWVIFSEKEEILKDFNPHKTHQRQEM